MVVDNFLFTHGGFDYLSPMISKNDLVMIDTIKLFNTNQQVSGKLEKVLESIKKIQSTQNISTSTGSSNSRNNILKILLLQYYIQIVSY